MTDWVWRRLQPAEKARVVWEHFTRVAPRYDLLNTLLSFGLHHLWKRAAVRMVGLKRGAVVLDLCGGTGDLARLAARAVGETGRVLIGDINRAMLEAGRPRVSRSPLGFRIAYVQGDAENLPFPEQAFDAVLVGFGVRNLSRLEQGFREMYRILKPGGKMMCLEFSQPTSAWFRRLYDLYSFYLMPLVGRVAAGSGDAYTYLVESIRRFPLAGELSAMLEGLGFTQVSFRRLTNGIAVVHLGVKPGGEV